MLPEYIVSLAVDKNAGDILRHFYVRQGVRCQSGVDTLSRRFRGQSGRLTFFPIAAASASIIALLPAGCASRRVVWLPGGCFAGVHYRRRDGVGFARLLVQTHGQGDTFTLRSTSSTFTFTMSPAFTTVCGLPQTCSTMKRCEPGRLDARHIDKRAKVGDVGDSAFEDHTGCRSFIVSTPSAN